MTIAHPSRGQQPTAVRAACTAHPASPGRRAWLQHLASLSAWLAAPGIAQTPSVAGESNPVVSAAGERHVLLARADGSVWGWGINNSGQLGEIAEPGVERRFSVRRPVKLALPGLVKQVAVLAESSLALMADGTVWAWGRGWYGELGRGPAGRQARFADGRVGSPVPEPVQGLDRVVQVVTSHSSALALRDDGSVWAWGERSALLNDQPLPQRWGETAAPALLPVRLPLPEPVQRLATATSHALALTADGRVLAWGANRAGQLGRGTRGENPEPEARTVPGLADAVGIAAGHQVSMALRRDGSLWIWGGNQHAQFGNGQRAGHLGEGDGSRLLPERMAGIGPVAEVQSGSGTGRHTLVQLRSGALLAWGNSDWGQTGTGVAADFVDSPKPVRLPARPRQWWATGSHGFATLTDGRFCLWGYSDGGEGLLAKHLAVPTVMPLPA